MYLPVWDKYIVRASIVLSTYERISQEKAQFVRRDIREPDSQYKLHRVTLVYYSTHACTPPVLQPLQTCSLIFFSVISFSRKNWKYKFASGEESGIGAVWYTGILVRSVQASQLPSSFGVVPPATSATFAPQCLQEVLVKQENSKKIKRTPWSRNRTKKNRQTWWQKWNLRRLGNEKKWRSRRMMACSLRTHPHKPEIGRFHRLPNGACGAGCTSSHRPLFNMTWAGSRFSFKLPAPGIAKSTASSHIHGDKFPQFHWESVKLLSCSIAINYP